MASPQYFHGNCFAGWTVGSELRVAETRGVDAVIEVFAYRLRDEGSGWELSNTTFDSMTLEQNYGAGSGVIRGGSSRRFSVSGRSPDRPAGPLSLEGNVAARDKNGARVETSFRLSTTISIDESPPPSSGACALP